MKTKFSKPCTLNLTVLLCETRSDPTNNSHRTKQNLKRLSCWTPICCCFLLKIARLKTFNVPLPMGRCWQVSILLTIWGQEEIHYAYVLSIHRDVIINGISIPVSLSVAIIADLRFEHERWHWLNFQHWALINWLAWWSCLASCPKEWKACMLSVHMTFVKLAEGQSDLTCFWHAAKIRESVGADYEATYYSMASWFQLGQCQNNIWCWN